MIEGMSKFPDYWGAKRGKIYSALSNYINTLISQEERENVEAGSYVYNTSKKELVSEVEKRIKEKLSDDEKKYVYSIAEDFGNMFWMS